MDNYVTRKIHLEFEADHEFPKDWDDDNIERYLAEIGIFGGGITMDVREKLVELLSEIIDGGFKWHNYLYESGEQLNNDDIASYLIANGVTVQEWISVDERLPQEKVNCIVHYKHAYCDNDDYWAIGMCFYDGEKFQLGPAYKVTHWMPIPQPPKGE